MKKVIGYEKNDFQTKEGKSITGYNVYLAEPISESKGTGIKVERIYLSDNKIATAEIDLDELFDREVAISYNRWGKVEELFLR